ncbi:MAG: ankyrin repeat domain-containing protein [Bacteroidota bacterium]
MIRCKIRILFIFSVIVLLYKPCFPQVDTISSDSVQKIISKFPEPSDSISVKILNENLLEAADKGNVDEILELLLKGADANSHNYDGVTALMYASQNGHLDAVKILVYNGANINIRPADGTSALIAATRFGHYEVMDYLIQQGAEINAKDNDSSTSLFYAAVYGYFIPADMLLFYGADYKCVAKDSSDALNAASFYGNKDIVELLINKGADINTKDKRGWTPLHCAVYGNHIEVVKLLVEKGALIDVKNSEGYTPLAIAAENGYTQVVGFLLQNKANASIYTDAKATPLLLSLYYSNYPVSKILKKQDIAGKEWKPYFNDINFSLTGFDMNNRDFMFGLYAGIHDIRYLTGIRLGYNTRLWADRILLPKTDSSFYQLWERRSIIYIEAEKVFRINTNCDYEKGFFICLKELYTYGKYRAMNQKPDDAFIFSPSAGFILYSYWGGFRFAYEYLKFNVKDFSPHRINASLFFTIHVKDIRKTHKSFDWL